MYDVGKVSKRITFIAVDQLVQKLKATHKHKRTRTRTHTHAWATC